MVKNQSISFIEKNATKPKTIFFLHGNSGSALSWSKQLNDPQLSDYRMVAFDLPAHGNSDPFKNEDKYNLLSIAELMAEAIDQKSPYTGGHCRRVPELTMMLGQAAIDTKTGPLKDFTLNEKEFYELKIAGWLHDCGKVTTPESVMDKPTKLSSIFDRIELVDQRFELLKQQAECESLKKQLAALKNHQQDNASILVTELEAFKLKCNADRDFLRKSNFGSEYMTSEDQQRISDIAAVSMGGWAC